MLLDCCVDAVLNGELVGGAELEMATNKASTRVQTFSFKLSLSLLLVLLRSHGSQFYRVSFALKGLMLL